MGGMLKAKPENHRTIEQVLDNLGTDTGGSEHNSSPFAEPRLRQRC
jgi:hypothetical protein